MSDSALCYECRFCIPAVAVHLQTTVSLTAIERENRLIVYVTKFQCEPIGMAIFHVNHYTF